MIRVAVTQRVDLIGEHRERRDSLDQRWATFLERCGVLPVLVPNSFGGAEALTLSCAGLLLTGGNSLVRHGGDAPERDSTETGLLNRFIRNRMPILGVCRGMQLIQERFGVPLRRVPGHVRRSHRISLEGKSRIVNSYHDWGSSETVEPLEVLCRAKDGVVESLRHRELPVMGIMWHPERSQTFSPHDIRLFKSHFRA